MDITPKHRVVESRFRELVAGASLPEPDEVMYEPASVGFRWRRDKLVVFVDFDPADPRLAEEGDRRV